MKFFSSLAAMVFLAIGASTVVAGDLYALETLPNGVSLPRRGVHYLTEQRRRELIDDYFKEFPHQRRAFEEAEPVRMVQKRGSSKKCKHGKKSSKKSTKSSGTKVKTQAKNAATKPKEDGTSVVAAGKGLIGMTFKGACSSPKASEKYPNGDISFLNCGISKSNPDSKWQAPNVKLSQFKMLSTAQAEKAPIFAPCKKYKGAFENASKQSGIPVVVLMSFAMQESTCNANVMGANGEIGLMQLTPDKCQGKNCHDANVNALIGAKYFADEIKRRNGNALAALGQYNGWGDSTMSYRSATSKQWGCHSQNNLDYLNQAVNGWWQGRSADSMKVYNNLASC